MSHMNLKEVKELIDLISEKGFAEFEFERQGFRLRIVRFKEPSEGPSTVTTPAASEPSSGKASSEGPSRRREASPETPPGAPEESVEPEVALHVIKSPIVGTFYRASSPDADPFVLVGDRVELDSVVCIIEAMKLMNEIQAETSGLVAQIYVENGQPVEYGQPLFGIKS